MKTLNEKEFADSREKWFMKLAKEYEKHENECVFMCDTPSPKGIIVIGNFSSKAAAGKFLSKMKSSMRGADVSSMQISKVLFGSLGLRDFDMRHTLQYSRLERKKMVPSIGEKISESIVENPNEV